MSLTDSSAVSISLLHQLQRLAVWQCQRTEKQLQAAALHISHILRSGQRLFQAQAALPASAPAAALLCSISNAQERFYPQKRCPSGSAARGRGPGRPVGVLAADAAGKNGAADERILISEVDIKGVEGDLKKTAQEAMNIRPNFAYTAKEVQDDVRRVFACGYFAKLTPLAEDTRDGVKLTMQVEPNPELQGIVATGANVLPQRIVEDAFRLQHGRTLNFGSFGDAINCINGWYKDRGLLGQVTGVQLNGGVAEVTVAEMQVASVNLKFVNPKSGEARDDGSTKPDIVLRHLCTRPGRVFSDRAAQADIDAVYSMGLFDDISISPQSAEDSTLENPKVDLTMNLTTRKTRGLSAGGGISAKDHADGVTGFIGSTSYSQRNLFGMNQKLSATVEFGQEDKLVRINHTDPWLRHDPFRTSRTVGFQTTRSSGNAIHGRAADDLANREGKHGASGGHVTVGRLTGGVEYGRPLAIGWRGTLGINWQRAQCFDEHTRTITQDAYQGPLTFSGGPHDTMLLTLLEGVYSGPQDHLVASFEQALPVQPAWLNFNRLRLRAEKTVPIFPKLSAHLCLRGGAIVGDLPPYEAFPIGGTNSVRGYSEGGVGTGRNYAAATMELHAPLPIKPVEGTLFADYGTDLDSGASVLGDPAGVRGKSGSGYGYGTGIRVDTPVGPLRLEYAISDRGLRRFHLGIGSHG